MPTAPRISPLFSPQNLIRKQDPLLSAHIERRGTVNVKGKGNMEARGGASAREKQGERPQLALLRFRTAALEGRQHRRSWLSR